MPRSLFSRLVLVLLTGLLVAQILSLAIHAHDRGQLLSQASGMQSAQRIADIVKVLEPLPPDERRRIVSILSAPPLLISLSDASPQAAVNAARRGRGVLFETMLRRFVGNEHPVSVVVTDTAPLPVPAKMHALENHGMHGGWMDPELGPHFFSQAGLSFVARVRLNDGSTVIFDSRQPEETLSWPYRLLGSLLILLAAVIVLSLIAVRWAMRPLNTLADAAEQLGTNINRPPLDEAGPVEVQRAARALNSMQAKLIGYLRDRTRILAAMSHDLKTPITRLRLRTELLDNAELRSKFDRDLREMEIMVAGTLDFMRGLENDERVQPIDVNALIQSVAADIQETGARVEVEGAARETYAGKPQALKRCLTNIIDNAIKYGKASRVLIHDNPERLELRVLDEGRGIPEASLERVFEPFYRLDPSRNRETGGTGLGLSIARSIAVSHGGTLILCNAPLGGLEAILTLPRRRALLGKIQNHG
ncbi:MAG: sensor histidine kinase [Burkholderiales bacterium]